MYNILLDGLKSTGVIPALVTGFIVSIGHILTHLWIRRYQPTYLDRNALANHVSQLQKRVSSSNPEKKQTRLDTLMTELHNASNQFNEYIQQKSNSVMLKVSIKRFKQLQKIFTTICNKVPSCMDRDLDSDQRTLILEVLEKYKKKQPEWFKE